MLRLSSPSSCHRVHLDRLGRANWRIVMPANMAATMPEFSGSSAQTNEPYLSVQARDDGVTRAQGGG